MRCGQRHSTKAMTKHKPQPPATAAIYARYSSTAQNDASIEQQVDECTAYAAANGLLVVGTYEDRAISGRSDKRPGFQKMIRAAERHEFGTLLTYKSNRIARNMYDALRYEARLDAAGVKVVYIREDFGDNAAGKLALRMMMSINEFYSDNMSEDIKRGMKDSAAQGRVVGPIPFGYKKGPDGRLAIDATAAPIVQEIFRRVGKGESYASIARDLNSRGYRTQLGRDFRAATMPQIVTNERYTGVYIYDDIRIEGGIPALIDKGEWAAVNALVKGRKASRGRVHDNNEYLLTGKIFCGKCLGPMVGCSGRGKQGNEYYYYSCQTKRNQHTCTKRNERKELIEEAVARAVLECVLDDGTLEWIADQIMKLSDSYRVQSEIGNLEARLKENKKQIQNILRAVEMGVIADEFKERAAQLQAEKKELEARIAAEQKNILQVDRDHVMAYLLMLRRGDYHDTDFQRQVIRDFVNAVYLYDDHFKLVADFTGERRVFNRQVDKALADGASVGITSPVAHHTVAIQTPDKRNNVSVSASGFVITWYFKGNAVKPQ